MYVQFISYKLSVTTVKFLFQIYAYICVHTCMFMYIDVNICIYHLYMY